MFDESIIKNRDFRGSVITKLSFVFGMLVVTGAFSEKEREKSGLSSFYFSFNNINDLELKADYSGCVITDFEITKARSEYVLRLAVSAALPEISLCCDDVSCTLKRYTGMSLANVYDDRKYRESVEALKYLVSKENISDTEVKELSGCTLYCTAYRKRKSRDFIEEFVLKSGGEEIYRYYALDRHARLVGDMIEHSNGRRYFLHKIDLYGLSVLDMESGEVFHYFPEGYEHDYRNDAGESFVITDVHYDKQSDLAAMGGSYRSGAFNVTVWDFSEPMSFNPYFVSVHDLIDHDYEQYNDIEFKEWNDNSLVIIADDYKWFNIDKSLLKERIIAVT